jgi:hypothetical protein
MGDDPDIYIGPSFPTGAPRRGAPKGGAGLHHFGLHRSGLHHVTTILDEPCPDL